MPLTISTRYTEERLLRFNRYVLRTKWPVWVILGVCSLIFLACCGLLALLNAMDLTMWLLLAAVLFIDAFYLVMTLLVTPLTVKKAKNINIAVTYTFTADSVATNAENELVSEQQTLKYSVFRRVTRVGNELYLFISRQQALIVDLSSLDGAALTNLGAVLAAAVDPQKLRWS